MPEHQPARPLANRALLIHLAAWLAVNAVLAGINLWQTPAEGEARTLWFQWPLIGWGIAVAAHALALRLARTADEEGLFGDPRVRGAAVHLFVYVAVNALLIAVNLIVTPNTLWFYWPLLGWGAGLALHAWLVYRAVLRRAVERYATEQRVLTEIQLERQAAEIAAAVAQPPEQVPEKKKKVAAKRRRKAPAKRAAKSKTAAKAKSTANAKGAAKSGKTSATARSGKTAKSASRSRKRAAEKR